VSAEAAEPPRYVGLVTRALGLAIDAGVINLVALVVELGVALVLSLLHLSTDVKTVLLAIAGGVYVLWSIGYFVGFWSATGQTPGSRVMQIRVVATNGERLTPSRAIVRLIGMVLAALPLCAGYVLILFDSRRRGLQDRLARTLVVEAPPDAGSQRRHARVAGSAAASSRSSAASSDRLNTASSGGRMMSTTPGFS
jgi:uncharacterized RDD family membrane protein YckC